MFIYCVAKIGFGFDFLGMFTALRRFASSAKKFRRYPDEKKGRIKGSPAEKSLHRFIASGVGVLFVTTGFI